jgi:hypothetical protein
MLHDALPRLSEMARAIAMDLRGLTGSLSCVCGANRKFIFNRAMRPNSPEHPRGRKRSSAVASCASMRAIPAFVRSMSTYSCTRPSSNLTSSQLHVPFFGLSRSRSDRSRSKHVTSYTVASRWLRSTPGQIGVNTGSPAKCLVALLKKLLTEAMIASGERPATCGVNTTLRRLSKASGGCGSPS